ncbi:hypothetical protein BGZ46_003405 [Entomortierella lignicola]|nr:hypothetical protein BGZ46_003405 [Entomortierella lignicola]
MFDTGGDYNLLNMDGIDPNDIATLLKLYLRELPSPLMPPALLEQFQSLLSTDRQICHTLRSILIRLPPQNYVVLSFLCHHLSKIASHAEKTKMTVSNLGVVFAPTLAIGSVLFKALLGGFYDGVDTFENREQGLQIVWGVSSQDTRNDIQENYEGENVNIIQERGHNDVDKEYRGSDDDKEEYIDPAVSGLVGDKEEYIDPSVSELVGDKEEYIDSDRNKEDESSYQDQGHNKYQDSNQDPSQQATLIITPFSDNDFGHKGSYFPSPVSHQGSGPVNSDNRTNVESVPEDPLSSTTLSSISLEDITSNDDSILMKAMLEREEVATKAPPPSSPTILGSIQGLSAQAPSATGILDLPSHLTSTATISSELNTTSTASNFSETHKNSGLGLSFPSASIPNLSQNTSALQIAVNTGTEDSTLFSTFAEGIANESLSRKSNENSRIDKLSSLKDASDASRLSLIPLKI